MLSVIIVAHAPLASALREVASHAFPEQADRVKALDVAANESPASLETRLRAALPEDQEVLVLVDVFGATPCNAAMRVLDGVRQRVICGVNVPMLWRVLCYGHESLAQVVGLAVSGATQGVMQLATTRPQNQQQKGAAHDPLDDQGQQ
jgi:PTS system ascorbate-specific IIA component